MSQETYLEIHMITKLNVDNELVAKDLIKLWNLSYPIEKELIGADYFPPLHRTMDEFLTSNTEFWIYKIGDEHAGCMEIRQTLHYTHIQSMLVHPSHFRNGIASALLDHAFETYASDKFIVETGRDNVPAVQLYLKKGFIKIRDYETKENIIKSRFEYNR